MAPFKSTIFLGINLLTYNKNEEEAREQVNYFQTNYDLPTTDLIRFGNRDLIGAIKDAIE